MKYVKRMIEPREPLMACPVSLCFPRDRVHHEGRYVFPPVSSHRSQRVAVSPTATNWAWSCPALVTIDKEDGDGNGNRFFSLLDCDVSTLRGGTGRCSAFLHSTRSRRRRSACYVAACKSNADRVRMIICLQFRILSAGRKFSVHCGSGALPRSLFTELEDLKLGSEHSERTRGLDGENLMWLLRPQCL